MDEPINVEVDIAGIGLGDERKALIRDRLTAAVLGPWVGAKGRIISADWRGDTLRFEVMLNEDVIPECRCGSQWPEVCESCATEDNENSREEGYGDGVKGMRSAVEDLIEELKGDTEIETKADLVGALRGRLEDLQPDA